MRDPLAGGDAYDASARAVEDLITLTREVVAEADARRAASSAEGALRARIRAEFDARAEAIRAVCDEVGIPETTASRIVAAHVGSDATLDEVREAVCAVQREVVEAVYARFNRRA